MIVFKPLPVFRFESLTSCLLGQRIYQYIMAALYNMLHLIIQIILIFTCSNPSAIDYNVYDYSGAQAYTEITLESFTVSSFPVKERQPFLSAMTAAFLRPGVGVVNTTTTTTTTTTPPTSTSTPSTSTVDPSSVKGQ